MQTYATQGFNEVIVCAGYKQHAIKEWFANYFLYSSDVTFNYTSGKRESVVHKKHTEAWRVAVVDIGLNTTTGGHTVTF